MRNQPSIEPPGSDPPQWRVCSPLLRLENAEVRYGSHLALKGVNMDVWPGDVLGFIGPNGAGKSTLLKAILGLVPLSGGSLVRSPEANRERIGYVPQALAMDSAFPLTVGEFVSLHLGRRGIWAGGVSAADRELVHDALARLRSDHLSARKIGELSGGQLQRVMLAAATISSPRLLLLDEPASGIDRKGSEELVDLLLEIHSTQGMTILFVSHDLHFVHRLATRVGCLNQSFCGLGPPNEVLHGHFLEEVFGNSFVGGPFNPAVA